MNKTTTLTHARYLRAGDKIDFDGKTRTIKRVTLEHPKWNEHRPTYTIQFANGQTEIVIRVWAFNK